MSAPPPEYHSSNEAPSSAVAYLTVKVPADAEVWLEGARTKQSGPTRLFVSPPLRPGNQYAYAVRARWQEEGREVEQTQEVAVQPGDRLTVTFPTGPDLEPLPPPRRLPPQLEQ